MAEGDRIGDERGGCGGVACDGPFAERTSEPGRASRMLLAYGDEPSFFQVGRAVGAHHQTVQRCIERALAYGPLAALDVVRGPARSRRSPPRPRHGCRSGLPQGQGSRLSARIVDDATARAPCARAWTRRGHACLASLLRARCARSSMRRRSSPTRSVITLNAAITRSRPRWRKSSVSIAR